MFVFPVLHVAAGVSLTYSTFAMFLNRTVVTVADGWLVVWHGPVPWNGHRRLPVEDVRAVFCDRSDLRTGWRNGQSAGENYCVSAVLTDNRRVWLLTGLENLTTAKFYEDRLEEWLGLPPEPVPGEAT
jgi:hypothetical protein